MCLTDNLPVSRRNEPVNRLGRVVRRSVFGKVLVVEADYRITRPDATRAGSARIRVRSRVPVHLGVEGLGNVIKQHAEIAVCHPFWPSSHA